ncbi:hypothetical protein Clacol_008729 [Clathrus columnatus]|uniref:AMP-dependent synthetase/ligase domain-containing protein n=1 Tax=Clathrus columnatus TaxID=1419009 RepID=A0AAV5ANQ1_9AGAM|nr:hypothetical protein Clacol_008729 [Clathrus columnatus]
MKSDELREVLRSLTFVGYGGAAFGDNERLWAMENSIALKNMYGSTEMGFTMLSENDPTILHPLEVPGLVHEFVIPDV